MSIIDTLNHSVVTYDPKTSKAFPGQRLSKVTWKTCNDKNSAYYNIKRESKCVSLPALVVSDVSDNLVVLAPHIIQFLSGVQDKMVREMLDAGGNVVSISTASVSVAAICEYLESSDESGRLTKESVGVWFDAVVADNLAVLLSEKLGVSEVPTDSESNKVLAAVSAFKGKVAALAGGKTSYEPKVCKSLLNAIALAPSDDVLAARFTRRLEKMIEDASKEVDLMELL